MSTVALVLAVASIVAPALAWAVIFATEASSSGARAAVVVLFVGCGLSLAGLVLGVMSSALKRGVVAILCSVLGGIVSFGSLVVVFLANAIATSG